MYNHLFDLLAAGQDKKSNHPLTMLPDGSDTTYNRFFDDVRRIVQVLIFSGLRPNDRVVMLANKSLDVIASYVGTVAAGGIYVPLNSSYTDSEVKYFIDDVKPTILICDQSRAPSLKALFKETSVRKILTLSKEGGGTLQKMWKENQPSDAIERKKQDLAAILYTSGTTGKPKGAMLSHGCLASNSQTLVKLWRFTSKDRLIHALPVHHTHGLFVAVNVTLMSGATLMFMDRFDAQKIVKLIPNATTMMGIPTFYTRLLQQTELNKQLTKNFRLFISGSAPLSTSTFEEWKSRTGHEILERYGMTEANMICSIPYEGPRQPGSVGKPLPGVELRIRDLESGEFLEHGKEGHLEIRSPSLFSGYWNLPKKTEEEFTKDGYFKTGDIARSQSNQFIEIVGRAKDLVISGGVNLYPKEIETAIEQHNGVIESAVIGVPHPDFGECAIAIVVTEPSSEVNEDSIRKSLDDKLARFKHPKHVDFVSSLPRNSMGKVQKSFLRQKYSKQFTS